MIWRKFKNLLLDLFFPKICLGCKQSDTYLCADCFNKIEIVDHIEHEPSAYLNKIIFATSYANPLIRELIKSYKYRFAQELAEPLSQLIIKTLEKFNLDIQISAQGGPAVGWQSNPNSKFLIVPVPLHKYRLRKRGFNQAELIAQKIANYFNLPINTNALQRIVYTEPQANLKDKAEKRLHNIRNAFAINPKNKDLIRDKIIILIDDVITTGGTLIEAGKVLKQNNAKEVWALTVAKG